MGAYCRAHPGQSENSISCLEGQTSVGFHCSDRHENCYYLSGSVSMAGCGDDSGLRCSFVHHDIGWLVLFHCCCCCCNSLVCGKYLVCGPVFCSFHRQGVGVGLGVCI